VFISRHESRDRGRRMEIRDGGLRSVIEAPLLWRLGQDPAAAMASAVKLNHGSQRRCDPEGAGRRCRSWVRGQGLNTITSRLVRCAVGDAEASRRPFEFMRGHTHPARHGGAAVLAIIAVVVVVVYYWMGEATILGVSFRKGDTGARLQIFREGDRPTWIGEFDDDVHVPRRAARSMGATPGAVMAEASRHVRSQPRVVPRRVSPALEHLHETFA
jgi:hypothetical protein